MKLIRFTLAHTAVIILKISVPFLFTAYSTVLHRFIFSALVLQETKSWSLICCAHWHSQPYAGLPNIYLFMCACARSLARIYLCARAHGVFACYSNMDKCK